MLLLGTRFKTLFLVATLRNVNNHEKHGFHECYIQIWISIYGDAWLRHLPMKIVFKVHYPFHSPQSVYLHLIGSPTLVESTRPFQQSCQNSALSLGPMMVTLQQPNV